MSSINLPFYSDLPEFADGGSVGAPPIAPPGEAGGEMQAAMPEAPVPETPKMPSMSQFTPEYAPVWDISEGEPVRTQLSHEMVEDGIRSGKYTFDRAAQIPVFSPDGVQGSVPADQFEDAINAGYKYATPRAIGEQKYGTPTQKAITAAEAVGQGLIGPFAPMLETNLGLATKEDILGRQKVNPMLHTGVEIGTMLAPALLTGGTSLLGRLGLKGAAAATGEAASVAAKIGEKSLPGLINKAAEILPTGEAIYSRIPLAAVRGAFEGALFQGSAELTKAYLDDPEQTAETVLPAIGLGALFGGAMSGAFSVAAESFGGLKKIKDIYMKAGEEEAAPLAKAAKEGVEPASTAGEGIQLEEEPLLAGKVLPRKGRSVLQTPEEAAPGVEARTHETHPDDFIRVKPEDRAKFEQGDPETLLKYDDTVPPQEKEGLLAGLRQPKRNAEEIEGLRQKYVPEIAQTPGGMLSRNEMYQRWEQAHSKTLLGQQLTRDYDAINNAVVKNTTGVTGDGSAAASKVDVGDAVSDSLNASIDKIDEISDKIYGMLREHTVSMPFTKADVSSVAEQMTSAFKKLKTSDPKIKAILRRTLNDLNLKDNLNDLKELRTKINKDFSQASSINERQFTYELSDILRNAERELLKSRVNSAALTDAERLQAKGMLALREEADKHFRENFTKYDRLRALLGDRTKVKSFSDLKEIFNNKLQSEKVIDRLKKMSYHDLLWFKSNFPVEFDAYRKFYLNDLVKTAKYDKGKDLRATKIFEQLFGRNSDARRNSLFLNEDELKILRDMHTLNQAIPQNWNPSGTAYQMHIFNLFNPLYWKAELGTGAAREAFLRAARPKVKGKKQYAEGGLVEGGSPEPASPMQQQAAFAQVVNQPAQIKAAMRMGEMMVRGDNMITHSVKSVFNPKAPHIEAPSQKSLERLRGYVDKAKMDPSFLMNIHNSAVPALNTPLAGAAARAVNYIAQHEPRPLQSIGLTQFKQAPTAEHDKYNQVLRVAEQPLYILNRVKNGTVSPEEIGAVKQIYPQLYQRLSNKLTEQVIETHSKGEAIPYRTRLGLSMFLGQPLDNTMRPQMIMAAQPKPSTPQQPQATQPRGGRHSTKPLTTMANLAKTPEQNRAQARSIKS